MDGLIEGLIEILKDILENILTTDNPLSNRGAKAMNRVFLLSGACTSEARLIVQLC